MTYSMCACSKIKLVAYMHTPCSCLGDLTAHPAGRSYGIGILLLRFPLYILATCMLWCLCDYVLTRLSNLETNLYTLGSSIYNSVMTIDPIYLLIESMNDRSS